MKRIAFLLLLLVCTYISVEHAYGQKAKYKNGVLTGPNNEYQVKLSSMLGKPRVEQKQLADGSVAVSISDDQCRTYAIFNHGATPYGPEGFVNDEEFIVHLKNNLKTDHITKSTFESRHGLVTLLQYSAQNTAPCLVTTYKDGGNQTEKPDANVGLAYLKQGNNLYSFTYTVAEKPFQWAGHDVSNIPERMQEFINNFTIQTKL